MQTDLNIPVLYQDENLIAVDKPAGLLVHAYKKETNERDHLMGRVKQQTGLYLYPVHRLDRPVSGIVLFGLNSDIVRELKAVWHQATTVKEYVALVKGTIATSGVFDFPLYDESKRKQVAETRYEPISIFKHATLMKVNITTGRKHQIRRHFSRRCANIIGDKKYGQGKVNREFAEIYGLNRIFLHATRLSVLVPKRNLDIDISSHLPDSLQTVLNQLHPH